MKPKKVIQQTTKAKLARARGRSQPHSTRDYPTFLKQLEHIVSTFKKLGYDLKAEKRE